METLLLDLRFSVKTLIKTPGFTLVAILALALGVGACTAIFSVVNAVLLRPLPYRDADRIVAIQAINKEGKRVQVTPANFLDWRAQNSSFEHLAAIFERTSNLAGDGEAERINLAMASANLFDVFGVRPPLGRLFLPEDEQAGHPAIVVLSHGLWQRRFGGDPEIVGKPITLDGNLYTVVGVAPAGFQFPNKTAAWLPPFRLAPTIRESMDPTQVRGFGFLSAVALLRPDVPLEQAKADMLAISARLREQYPETNNNRFEKVELLHTNLVGDTSAALWMLFGAVGFVLLIACANVANLLLVRATARQKEIAVRTALGASRLRIVRQLLTESLVLALLGGAFGLLFAWWGLELLVGLLPKDFPRLTDIQLDLSVLGFTLLVTVLTGVLFGFAPAWQVSKADVHDTLKENSRSAAGGRRNRFRSVMVMAEVALSLVLLIGAGLMFRSFLGLQAVDAGFNPDQVLTMRLSPSGSNFRDEAQFIAFYQNVSERIREIPGVLSVGAINTLPLSKGPTTHFRVEGREPMPVDRWPGANYRNVTPDYFQTMAIPVLQGRVFDDRDSASTPPVVLINRVAAEQHFAGEDPVGKRINFGGVDGNNQPVWSEIVGVVGDVRSIELNTESDPEVYTASWQDAFGTMSYVIHTSVEPAAIATAVRQAVQDVDRAQPVSDVRTMEKIVSDAVTQPRFNLTLLGVFGAIALILSAAGIYGVMAFSAAQRTHEIGIRLALGAKSSDVLRLILGQGLRLTAAGIGFGLAASFMLTRFLATLLFGISATDPLTFAVVASILTAVALLACYVPARRAAKTDPLVALRGD